MGLYAAFDVSEFNYPFDVSGEDAQGKVHFVEVDYGEACEAFVETFLEVALDLVPVRTGYLYSTIDANTDGYSFCWAEATADYAEYVEYGTWKMDAQPYFQPALEEAMAVFHDLAGTAVAEAEEILEDIISTAMEAAMS